MGIFKKFLKENEEALAEINTALNDMDADEIDLLGHVLYTSFFSDEEESENDDDFFSIDDVIEMIDQLGADFYEDILDLVSIADEDEDEDPVAHQQSPDLTEAKVGDTVKYDGELYKVTKRNGEILTIVSVKNKNLTKTVGITHPKLEEGVTRRMIVKNMNRKKRKFMAKTKADMRRTVAQRKKENRLNRAGRKRYYRANKQKIASYQATRKVAMSKGKHIKKLRKNA